jgi:hypothetical protein
MDPVIRLCRLVLAIACACGAPPAPPTAAPQAPIAKKTTTEDAPYVDPIAALAPAEKVSYLVPGRVQLEIGGTAIEGPGGSRSIQVSLIGKHGNTVRAAVRLEHARFSLWTDRARLLSVLARDHSFQAIYRPSDETHVRLRAGAVVRVLARQVKEKRVQVRYVGALEIEGWIPEEALADEGVPRSRVARFPRHTKLRAQHVFPGAVIRREPKWASEQLAVVANAYMLDTMREIDQAWSLVAYDDSDLAMQGFVSRRDPPGRVHKPKDPDIAPQKITPNGKVASGTCLYARVKGEAIGYIVGDQDVTLDDAGGGWWTLTIDSPWGPLPFSAQGPTNADLVGCAPEGSVPPSRMNAAPPVPAP